MRSLIDNLISEWDKDVGRDTSTYLLPGLQKLRQICNYAPDSIPFEEKQPALDDCEEDDFIYEESRTKKRRTENSTASHMGQNFEYQRVLQSSSKLQVLEPLRISYFFSSWIPSFKLYVIEDYRIQMVTMEKL